MANFDDFLAFEHICGALILAHTLHDVKKRPQKSGRVNNSESSRLTHPAATRVFVRLPLVGHLGSFVTRVKKNETMEVKQQQEAWWCLNITRSCYVFCGYCSLAAPGRFTSLYRSADQQLMGPLSAGGLFGTLLPQ